MILWTICSLPDSSIHGDSPGKNTGVGCHALLQGIFPIQESNPDLRHCRQISVLISIWNKLWSCSSVSEEFICNTGDLGSIPWLGRSPGGGHGNPLQYSFQENLHGQRSLAGYSSWGQKESDMTERLNWTELNNISDFPVIQSTNFYCLRWLELCFYI